MKGYKLFFLFFCFLLIIFLVSNFKKSVFFVKKERINILFYGKKTVIFSLGLKNNLTYLIVYPANLYLEVPGGYGFYRLGGIGKLVALEKKPEIFKKTFSSNSSFFLDLYFYPKKEEIYHEEFKEKKNWPSFSEIFFNSSNANFFDRIFCLYYFFINKPSIYKVIEIDAGKFDRKKFFDQHQALFYKKIYRQENLTIQILYKEKYKVADLLSKILEGEGLRVVDISQDDNNFKKECVIFYSSKKISRTVIDISRFFNCNIKKKETSISDIIIKLGNLEESWEVI